MDDYEYEAGDDWKAHDHQDHAANADYYDQIAREQAGNFVCRATTT